MYKNTYFPPNQLVDIASKKLLAAVVTGDRLRFFVEVLVVDVLAEVDVGKLEAVKVLLFTDLLPPIRVPSRPLLLVMGSSENRVQVADKGITLCSCWSCPF